jgi:hypothetical protein
MGSSVGSRGNARASSKGEALRRMFSLQGTQARSFGTGLARPKGRAPHQKPTSYDPLAGSSLTIFVGRPL